MFVVTLLTAMIVSLSILFSIGVTLYGLYLSFSASVVLGVICLLIGPLPSIIGLVALFGRPDVAKQIAKWLKLKK